ncbi:EAL domain-containing protein [Acinetobacter rudis]|uniref:putative bifunctional diguanylate cyclase/phosphodiesterase n=1 Tax=Acinetobacter rudis TaxID=632955 RepID=UPI00280E2A02|nr:EAL domain-containing protein [Acinetobacter rudis]MDQ8952030.1 EAL domain-containing protein [Acinetobacter rudis]
MMDMHKQRLSHHMDRNLILGAAPKMQFFIAGLAVIIMIYLLIYPFEPTQLSNSVTLLLLFIETALMIALYVNRRFLVSRSIKPLDCHSRVISFILGLGLGLINYAVVMDFLAQDAIGYMDVFLWLMLPLSIIYVSALITFNQRPLYFLLIFIPSIITFLSLHILFLQHISSHLNSLIGIWLVTLLLAVMIVFYSHLRMRWRCLNHDLLHEKNQQALKIKQLRQVVQQHRTEIESMNQHLMRYQTDLCFTQENAGVNTWFWDISARQFTVSNEQFDLNLKYDNGQTRFIIHPRDLALYRQKMRQYLRGQSELFELQYRVKKDDQWFWIHDVGKITARDPVSQKPLQMIGIFKDINEEKDVHQQLRLAANLFNQITEGLFVLDKDLRYISVNNYFQKLTGLKRNQLIGQPFFSSRFSQKDLLQKKHEEILQQVSLFGEYRTELQEQYMSGNKQSIGIRINRLNNTEDPAATYVGNAVDLTERKQQEQRVSYLKQYDLLTDLPNRFYFHYRLNKLITQEPPCSFALFRLNIDRFRLFNDLYFNPAGDELLRKFAERLSQYCNNALLTAYLNNDDFVVALQISDANNNVDHLAQGLLTAFQAPFHINGQEKFISISMGIAIHPKQGTQVDVLLRKAEDALLKAKQLGGNTYHLFNEQSYEHLSDKIILRGDLQQALKKKQLVVYYQPQVSSTTLQVVGFEALIRWQHPQYGLISPNIFIPLAEETSLITEIGQFVIFESCKQLQIWRELGFSDIRVSVNIVAQQVLRGQLLLDLDTAMAMYQIKGDQLELELIESSLLENSSQVIDFLSKIKERDISISLDDFGMGYSSLAYLSQYPIDKLKIDRAFISRIGDQKEEAIVNAIIAMGKAMGMSLIAEGVENQAQLKYLQQHNCDVLQGFYFSKPLTALETTAYLSQYKHSLVSHSLSQ